MHFPKCTRSLASNRCLEVEYCDRSIDVNFQMKMIV